MSITAARLQAEVGADTSGFDRGMKHADSVIAKAPSRWGSALKVGAGVGLGLAAGFVVRGAVGAITAGLTSLKEQGVVVAQTNAVIRSTKGAANVSAAAIRDLSNATEAKTAIDDKAVQAGANMLLTFTNIRNAAGAGNDIFNQSVAVLADMSTAMGTDMKGGAIQLGKALNDPVKGITALTRVGVTFTDQQKKQIESLVKQGKTLAAQKVILHELNTEFGGSGAAFRATDAGQAAAMQDAVEGIQQSLAKGLLPTITSVRMQLTNFLSDPATIGQAEALGNAIAGIFSEGNLRTAASVMTTAASAISTAIGLFSKLPPQVQALAVGAIALKKVTGIGPMDIAKGVGNVVSGNGLFGRGASPANPLYVSDVTGKLTDKLGGAAAAAGAAETGWAAGGLAGLGVIAASVIGSAAVAAAIITLENTLFGITPADVKHANTHGQFGPRTAAQGGTVLAANGGPFPGKARDDIVSGIEQSFAGKVKDDLATAGSTFGKNAADYLIHSNLFGKAAAARTATKSEFSFQVLEKFLKGDKGVSSQQAFVTAQAVTLQAINKLRTPGSEAADLKGARGELRELKGIQARFLASGDTAMANKIGADIRSLQAAIDRTTAAVNNLPLKLKMGTSVYYITDSAGNKVPAKIGTGKGATHGALEFAGGVLGTTSGVTRMIAGEAGRETVAILRHPRTVTAPATAPVTIPFSVRLPGIRSYDQTHRTTRFYGPVVPR